MVKPRQKQKTAHGQRAAPAEKEQVASNVPPPSGEDDDDDDEKGEGTEGLASVLTMHDTPAMVTPREDIYSPGHSTDPRLYVIKEGNSTLSTEMYEIEKSKMKEQSARIDQPIAEVPDNEANAKEGSVPKVPNGQSAKHNKTTTNTRKAAETPRNETPKKRGQINKKSPIKRSNSQSSKHKGKVANTPDLSQTNDRNSVQGTPFTPDISHENGKGYKEAVVADTPVPTHTVQEDGQEEHQRTRRPSDSSCVSVSSTPGGWDTPLSSVAESGTSSRNESRLLTETPRGQLKLTQVKCAWSSTTLSSAAPTDASDDLDDHINVVVRIRPLNSQEVSRRDSFAVTFHGSGRLEVAPFASAPKQFGFNVVFEPEATQEDVFNHSGVKKLIDMALNGYACTALAFGQTGSGKTHTMTGPPQQSADESGSHEFEGGKHPDPEMVGIMQRSFSYLLSQSSQIPGNKVIRASYLEIYNEQVIDLLNPNQKRYLQVRWSKNKGFYVENLFVAECESVDDLMAVLEEGMRNRQTGSHGLNEFSSRSHSMLTLTIDTEQQDPDDENLYLTKRGKLTFVDLAGSEKVKDSESTDKTLVESNNINRSLLVLGNCISSLGDPKKRQGHIPYRDSKLTKLLADSLGGNGVTLMVACVTPSSHHAPETINTLRYASRAKRIKTKPVVKMDPREKLILSLKREIKILRNENVYLRQQLEFPAKPKGALQKENDEKFMKFLKHQGKDGVTNTGGPPPSNKGEAGLYEMLQEYMIENEALRSENSEMHSTKDRIKREQQLMYRENERLLKKIEALEKERQQGGWQRPLNGPPPGEQYYDPRQSPVNRPPPGPGGQQWRVGAPPQRQPIAEPYPVGQQNIPPNARGKQGPPPAGPKRPPHRLAEPIQHRGTPPQMIPDGLQNGGYPDEGYMSPRGRPPLQNGPVRQESPMRLVDSRRSSQVSTSDSIRTMNEKLKQEIMELEGEIEHHHMVNSRTNSLYGSQASVRSGRR